MNVLITDSTLLRDSHEQHRFQHRSPNGPTTAFDPDQLYSPVERRRTRRTHTLPLAQQFKVVLFPRWLTLNWLLPAVPIGFALKYSNQDPVRIFVLNFLAIFPCTAIIMKLSTELILRTGPVRGVLIAVTFKNVAQTILAILLLKSNQLAVLSTSFVGTVLANMLLALGIGILAGAYNRQYQNLNIASTGALVSILLKAVGYILVTTILAQSSGFHGTAIRSCSRGLAITMLIAYAAHVVFDIKTHLAVNEAPTELQPIRESRRMRRNVADAAVISGLGQTAHVVGLKVSLPPLRYLGDEEGDRKPRVSALCVIGFLVFFTALVTFCTLFASDNIQSLLQQTGMSTTFLGLILLPLLTIDPSTFVAGYKDRQTESFMSNTGASVQNLMVVLPLAVLLGWILDRDFTMVLNQLELVELTVTTVVISFIYSSMDGRVHWLHGVCLVAFYMVIAITAYFSP